jgi:hypothetical protein
MSSPSDRPTAGLGLTIVLGAVAALGAAAIDMNLPAALRVSSRAAPS